MKCWVGYLNLFFKIMAFAERILAKRVSEAVFRRLIHRWSEFFDVDASSSKAAAFAQRLNYVLGLAKNISEDLFKLATNPQILSANRTVLYNTRVPFESGILQFRENLKKRKITHDTNQGKAQKRKLGNSENNPKISEIVESQSENSENNTENIENSENNPENIENNTEIPEDVENSENNPENIENNTETSENVEKLGKFSKPAKKRVRKRKNNKNTGKLKSTEKILKSPVTPGSGKKIVTFNLEKK